MSSLLFNDVYFLKQMIIPLHRSLQIWYSRHVCWGGRSIVLPLWGFSLAKERPPLLALAPMAGYPPQPFPFFLHIQCLSSSHSFHIFQSLNGFFLFVPIQISLVVLVQMMEKGLHSYTIADTTFEFDKVPLGVSIPPSSFPFPLKMYHC